MENGVDLEGGFKVWREIDLFAFHINKRRIKRTFLVGKCRFVFSLSPTKLH